MKNNVQYVYVKCVSKVLGQMWALLALIGVPGLLRHILPLLRAMLSYDVTYWLCNITLEHMSRTKLCFHI